MEYPQILLVNGRFDNPRIYPGEQEGLRMSLEYYRHHKGWTKSQNFIDQVEILGVPQGRVDLLLDFHDIRMHYIGIINGFHPKIRFEELVQRLLEADARQNAMTD